MTTEERDAAGRVLDTAIAIANRAPRKRGTYSHSAQIPWHLIEELRAALDDLGQPWQ